MADSALESTTIVTPSYQSKVKDNDLNESLSTANRKTQAACGSLRPSSPSRIKDGVATGNVPLLDNQAASTTKKTADSDKKKKNKMADETRSSSRACEAIRLTSSGKTQEMTVNEHFDGQRRSLTNTAFVSDEKKRRRSDRYDSSESSDSGVASLTCSDTSSWSSSSDITEPVSPASPSSSQPSPISQTLLDNSATNHHFVAVNSARVNEEKSDSKKKCHLGGIIPDKQFGSTSVSILSSFPCTIQKRCRRHSDSTSTDMSHYHKSDCAYVKERGKRVRYSSGESISTNSFTNKKESPDADVSDMPANLKWLGLLWRNNGSNALSAEKNQSRKQLISSNQRQSWPLAKHLQQKSGQLKITEFFSSQVKQHWNYTRFSDVDNKGVKLPVCLSNSNWRLPVSRVAIVSVAQVDHHSDDCSFNPRSLSENVGFERPVPATRPLNCGFPAEAPGPAPIRFPIDQVTSCHKNEVPLSIGINVIQCLWQHCKSRLTSGQSLLEHIQNVHVVSQSARPLLLPTLSGSDATAETAVVTSSCDELYSCQWEGCKVQGRTSSSRAWLERHVLLHGGHKPFRCIVDLCEQRFNSQAALQRHVNAHFNQESGQNSNGHGIKRDNAPAKIMRRNSKKLKHRRSIVAPARLFDFFDSGVMERLRHQLINSQMTHNRVGVSCITNDLIVRSQIIARRLDANGKSRVLLRWIPHDVLPDQWVLEDEVVPQKTVALRNLSSAVQIKLQKLLIQPALAKENESKQRRKR